MLPRTHAAAAGVLISDPAGRVLMVGNPYRSHLVLPGGMVEPGETPVTAAEREVFEEVGLLIRVTRLLVIEAKPQRPTVPVCIQFVFDTAPLVTTPTVGAGLTLQPGEISAAQWLSPEQAIAAHGERGRARLAAALDARLTGAVVYLDPNLPSPTR